MLKQIELQAALRIAKEKRMWARTLIEALPRDLRRAQGLSVIVNVARHWHDEDVRREHGPHIESALTAIVSPLFEESIRRWRRNLKPHATFVVESWLCVPGEEATCAGWVDGAGAYAALSLPISWFTEVWARGMAVVDGCFVVDLTESSPDGSELRVLALRRERQFQGTSRSVGAAAVVMQAGADGEWRLQWT